MKAHMTEQARYSVDYDGSTDIEVKRWESDRDSDLTSDRAVAEMIQMMSPKVGQDISSHPEAVHVDGGPMVGTPSRLILANVVFIAPHSGEF